MSEYEAEMIMGKWQKNFLAFMLAASMAFAWHDQAAAGDGIGDEGLITSEETEFNENDENVGAYETYEGEIYQEQSPYEEQPRQQDWDQVTAGDWENGEKISDNQAIMAEEIDTRAEEGNIEAPEASEGLNEAEECEAEVEAAEPEADIAATEPVGEPIAEAGNDVNHALADLGVMTGDINGDGELNAVDCALLQKYIQQNYHFIDMNRGDINGDGVISLLDVHALLNLLRSEGKGTGDVNGDGRIDSYDVQELTAYMAGQTASVNRKNADLNGDGEIDGEDLKILREVVKARNL